MAASLNNLFRLDMGGATAAGRDKVVSIWAGCTEDAVATVEAAGWFNVFAGMLTKGDIIFMSMVRAGTPVLKAYIVVSNTGTVVTIAAQTVA
jgi:hypothetical protein